MVNVGYIKEFGLAIFLVNALSRILRKLNFHNKILWAVDRFKHRVDEKWLCRRFGYLIQNDNPDLNIIKGGGRIGTLLFFGGKDWLPLLILSVYV